VEECLIQELGTIRSAEGHPTGLDEQFRRLLETLPVPAYTCDAEGLITFYNELAVEAWGRTPKLLDPEDRWCGSFKLYSAVDGSPIPHGECWMALAIKTGEPQNGQEIVVERPDGRRRTALAHANPIRDARGRLIGAVNVFVDISDRKRAEEAQSRLGAIVESSDDAIIGKTLEGIIVSWNASAERIFGYTAEEAVGQSILLIIPPERQAEEGEILARLCAGERIDHYETVRVAKDGRQIHVSLTSSPIRDGTGQVIGASKVARDITAKKREEEGLRLLQGMSVRLSTALDEDYILGEALRTAAAIQGTGMGLLLVLSPTEDELVVGASLGFDAEALAAFPAIRPGQGGFAACLEQEGRVIIENAAADPCMAGFLEVFRRLGIKAIHSTPLTTRSGKALGVLSTQFTGPHRPSEQELSLVDLCARQAVDFFENARLYTELREADRAKNDFLAILAHELRNPLAPIRNTVETVRLTGAHSPELRAGLGVIDRQILLMTRLIDDLLDVSRITQNKLELRKERLELADVIHAAVESSRPILTARAHDFGVDLPPEPIMLEADLARLAQVTSNLLNNAAKYTERGGRIRLTARREGNEAIVSVRDNGIGIPEQLQARVFDMFAQVEHSLDRSEGGLGIGLHLARKLAEMHGGNLSVRSAGSGKGSEFTLRLPVPEEPAPQRRCFVSDWAPQSLGSPLRILVVDDNRDSADSLGLLLEIPGNVVRIAYDGLHAVEMAAEFRPDVVLLDIGLPKLDGYQVAQRIRQQPGGMDLTLIALTGWGQEEARVRAKQAGFDSHLVKPVDPGLLLRHLGSLRRSNGGRPADSTP
jgi:PAS domain S-box-containing protein